jgi:hypothetical protein
VVVSQGAFWAFVYFLRQGPALQVYGILAIETLAALCLVFWVSKSGRIVSLMFFALAALLGVVAVYTFKKHEVVVSPNQINKSYSGTAVQVLDSTNANVRTSPENAFDFSKATFNGGNQQFGSGNTLIVTNNLGDKAEFVFSKPLQITDRNGGTNKYEGEFQVKALYVLPRLLVGVPGAQSVTFKYTSPGNIWGETGGITDGMAYHGIQNAYPGLYRITVITTNPPSSIIVQTQ